MNLDPNTLTIDDIIEIERVSGVVFDELFLPENRGILTKGMIYASSKRENPDFTWDDAGKITLTSINAAVGQDAPKE